MNVAAIVVNYRTAEITAQSTHHLLTELDRVGPAHVFLIDNDSGDGSHERLERESRLRGWDGRVTLIAGNHNGGYGYGINQAMKAALRAGANPRYFYIINPDAVPRIDSVRTMVAYMDANPDVGVVGGSVYGPNGDYTGGAFRFPSIKGELESNAHLGLITNMFGDQAVGMDPPGETTDVDWVAGTTMLVRREVVDRGIWFDEDFFLYFEEVDFCRRVRAAGWRIAFVADAAVEHIGSVSTGMIDHTRRMPGYWFASRRRYLHKHHGPRYARGADAAFALGYLIFLAKRVVTGEPAVLRPQLLRDFLLHSLRTEVAGKPLPSGAPTPPDGGEAEAPVDADQLALLELVLEDLATYDADPWQPGFWAVLAHRLGRRATKTHGPVGAALEVLHRSLFTSVDWIWGIKIPRAVELGRRVRLWHNGCMLLDAKSIGNDVHIRQDTTFGVVKGRAKTRDDLPVIEDRADIGSGACVLGPVRVGTDAVVGANSVVMKNVPPRATVLGVPARMIPT